MCWGFRKSHRKVALPKHLDQDPSQLVFSRRKNFQRVKNNKSYKKIRLKDTQRYRKQQQSNLLLHHKNNSAQLLQQLLLLKQQAGENNTDQHFNAGQVEIAIKQLQRRQKLGPFRGHRKNGNTYRSYNVEDLYQKQIQQEDEWRCPTCYGYYEYYNQDRFFNQENQFENKENLSELIEPKFIQEGNLILKKLRKTDMIEYHWLNLGRSSINNMGIKYFSSGLWDGLCYLDLGCNKISNSGCKQLAKADLPELRELYLGSNQISAEGVHCLSKSKWRLLYKISLGSAGGLQFVLKGHFPYLRYIYIQQQSCSFWKLIRGVMGRVEMDNHRYEGAEGYQGLPERLQVFSQTNSFSRSSLRSTFYSTSQRIFLHKIYNDRGYYIQDY